MLCSQNYIWAVQLLLSYSVFFATSLFLLHLDRWLQIKQDIESITLVWAYSLSGWTRPNNKLCCPDSGSKIPTLSPKILIKNYSAAHPHLRIGAPTLCILNFLVISFPRMWQLSHKILIDRESQSQCFWISPDWWLFVHKRRSSVRGKSSKS